MPRKTLRRCRRHLTAADETYVQHLRFSTTTALSLVGIALRLLVHGLVPVLYEFGASDRISRLHKGLQQRARITSERQNAAAAGAKQSPKPSLVRTGTP
jgi:Family of unknown function (DUF6356)